MKTLSRIPISLVLAVFLASSAGIYAQPDPALTALTRTNIDRVYLAQPVPARVKQPDPAQVLETTKKIADKVIRETSFDYRLVPMGPNAGIMQVNIDGHGQRATGEGGIYYAYGKMGSDRDTSGLLGLSFRGEIVLFLNGSEIFRGTSPVVKLQEYTYNRFRFHREIPVRWKKGENELLVKFRQGPAQSRVLLLPLTEIDTKAEYVNLLPVTGTAPGVHWLTSGRWQLPSGEDTDFSFPPEKEHADYYRQGNDITAWEPQPSPLLRELVIPETASYQRDAYSDWHYANGGTLLGILSLHEITGDKDYPGFMEQYTANLLANFDYFRWQYFTMYAMRGSFHRVHRMTMLDDSGGPAIPLAQLQLMGTGSPAHLPLLLEVQEYVMKGQERLDDGTFSRPEPEPATVWADDLFMSSPFLLRMAKITCDESLYDEVARQVVQFNRALEDPETGLYYHGWYDRRKENTPVLWGRANGWVAWATSEVLMHMPENQPRYQEVLEIFRDHMEALAGFQDVSGMWHQVLDHPETWEETSCTAMFTLAMARGVRMGWLKKSYRDRALRGWNALQDKIASDGTVKDICRGTGIGESLEFYATRDRFDHDPRGLGAVITAGCEIYLLVTD
ncbi:MAG: glycoside hydrolase family 88/105 protein [Bacteroidota bacterium]